MSSSSSSAVTAAASTDLTLAEALAVLLAAQLTDVTVSAVVDPRVNPDTVTGWEVRVMPWEVGTRAEWRDWDRVTRGLLVAVVGPADPAVTAQVEAGLGLMDRVRGLFAPGGALRDVMVSNHTFRPPLEEGKLLRLETLLNDSLCVAVVIARYEHLAES